MRFLKTFTLVALLAMGCNKEPEGKLSESLAPGQKPGEGKFAISYPDKSGSSETYTAEPIEKSPSYNSQITGVTHSPYTAETENRLIEVQKRFNTVLIDPTIEKIKQKDGSTIEMITEINVHPYFGKDPKFVPVSELEYIATGKKPK